MIKRHHTTIALLAICIAAGSGCATDTRKIPHTVGTTSHSEAQRTPPLRTTVEQANTPPTAGTAREPLQPTDQLDLSQALQLALTRNPGLNVQTHRIQASRALVRQAGFLPNPRIKAEVEEYDRAGAGFDSRETTIVLSQEIELGGKRRWRTRQAEITAALAQWDYEEARLDVNAVTRRRAVILIAAQQRLALAHSAVELAKSVHGAAQERVSAGKEPPLQATKASAALELTRLDTAAARAHLNSARIRLAQMWGANEPHFTLMTGDLDSIPDAVPELQALRRQLDANPELARLNTEQEQQEANLAAAKAARIPNVNASIAMQNYEEDDTDALAFGIGAPLPLFNRNQGNIAAAQHILAGANAQRMAVRGRLTADLAAAHAKLQIAHRRVRTLTQAVVPAMESAFSAARGGYQQGKFGFLDMLDAQRGLVKTRYSLIDALSDYHVAAITIQRITGTEIEAPLNHQPMETK
jgi:cobalt-zinc-cadmium efflux system outer membrane protein